MYKRDRYIILYSLSVWVRVCTYKLYLPIMCARARAFHTFQATGTQRVALHSMYIFLNETIFLACALCILPRRRLKGPPACVRVQMKRFTFVTVPMFVWSFL